MFSFPPSLSPPLQALSSTLPAYPTKRGGFSVGSPPRLSSAWSIPSLPFASTASPPPSPMIAKHWRNDRWPPVLETTNSKIQPLLRTAGRRVACFTSVLIWPSYLLLVMCSLVLQHHPVSCFLLCKPVPPLSFPRVPWAWGWLWATHLPEGVRAMEESCGMARNRKWLPAKWSLRQYCS